VILHCNFEELRALASGAELLLAGCDESCGSVVAAPAEALAQVELLRPRLNESLSITTLAEQRAVRGAIALICEGLHERMEEKVLQYHPAHEEAVNLYFDYAHAIAVLSRLDEIGAEMSALIELMTGAAPTDTAASTVTFPD
jgi:hypothetical protein